MLDDLAWPKGSGGISTLREGYGGLRNGKMAGHQEQLANDLRISLQKMSLGGTNRERTPAKLPLKWAEGLRGVGVDS